MGLDMYAYTTEEEIPPVGFDLPDAAAEIAYWRKHPNLHGWMEALYRAKGGTDIDFNCVCLRLDDTDIDALEKAVTGSALPHTEGFFFGQSTPEDKEDDLAFIHKARDALAKGLKVLYTSWW